MNWLKQLKIKRRILALQRKNERIIINRLAIEQGVDFELVARVCRKLWEQGKVSSYIPRTTKGWERS